MVWGIGPGSFLCRGSVVVLLLVNDAVPKVSIHSQRHHQRLPFSPVSQESLFLKHVSGHELQVTVGFREDLELCRLTQNAGGSGRDTEISEGEGEEFCQHLWLRIHQCSSYPGP